MSDNRIPLNSLTPSAGDGHEQDPGNRILIRELYKAIELSNKASEYSELIRRAKTISGDGNNDATMTK